MPLHPIDHPDNTQPEQMLPRQKNCAAMAFSRVLSQGVYATLNYFVRERWIANAGALENWNAIKTVIQGLGLVKRFDDKESWATVLTGMKGLPDGNYFAINWEVERKYTAREGHAFAIVKKGNGIGIYGNNAELTDKPYNSVLKKNQHHLVSVWGP